MQVKTITFQRVKNLGNYESKRLEMTAELKEDEEFREVAFDLILAVEHILAVKTEKMTAHTLAVTNRGVEVINNEQDEEDKDDDEENYKW